MLLNSNQVINSLRNYRKCINILYFRHLHMSYILYPRKQAPTKKTSDSLPTSHSNTFDIICDHNTQFDSNTNFYGVEGDEGVIIVDKISQVDKLAPDLNKKTNVTKKEFRFTSFGAVRLDAENKPLYVPIEFQNQRNRSLKFDTIAEDNLKKTLSEKTPNSSDKDKNGQLQYFNVVNKTENSKTSSFYNSDEDCISNNSLKKSSDSKFVDQSSLQNKKFSYIDSLYFPPESNDQHRNSSVIKQKEYESNSKNAVKESKNQTISESFIDSFYFPFELDITKTTTANAYEDTSCNIKHFEETNLDSNDQPTINASQNQAQALSDSIINQLPIKNYSDTRQSPVSYIEEFYFPEEDINNLTQEGDKCNLSYIDEFKTTQHINSHIKNSSMSNTDLVIVENINMNEINVSNDTNSNAEINSQDLNCFNQEAMRIKLPSKKSLKSQSDNIKNLIDYNTYEESSQKFQKNNFAFKTNSMSDKANYKRQKVSKPEIVTTNENINNTNKSAELPYTNIMKLNSENQSEMAHDFVKKLREKKFMPEEVKKGISAKKEKKLDSKGFRILKHQVPSLKYFTRDEILELLKENILHIDDDIVILNKPYNLVIHESSTTKDAACLSMYLDDMAKMLDQRNKSPELFTVHRLDKETTGCLLLARNDVTAQRLKSLFVQRKIMRTYWIVTCRIPDPMEGVIDIPISEGKIENKSRMVLHPNLPSEMHYKNHSKPGKRAVTRYKVIATSGSAALVEVQPETGLKHQIRVHFGLGLSCPILGDHKYSYLDRLVPQKLASDLLQKLRVRQSKVRHIPLHIHSKHILIPQYSEGRNLFITAPLPKHMSENLRSLKFKKK